MCASFIKTFNFLQCMSKKNLYNKDQSLIKISFQNQLWNSLKRINKNLNEYLSVQYVERTTLDHHLPLKLKNTAGGLWKICLTVNKPPCALICACMLRMAFLALNIQHIAQISQPQPVIHFLHSLSKHICLWYEYGCQSHEKHYNRTHSLVLYCIVLQHQANTTLD